MRQQFK